MRGARLNLTASLKRSTSVPQQNLGHAPATNQSVYGSGGAAPSALGNAPISATRFVTRGVQGGTIAHLRTLAAGL